MQNGKTFGPKLTQAGEYTSNMNSYQQKKIKNDFASTKMNLGKRESLVSM